MEHVTRLEVWNFKGIEHLIIEPKTVTLFEGQNGAGKTSALRAFLAVITGGHDPSVIGAWAPYTEIHMEISNGIQIKKTIREDKSILEVLHPETGNVSRPQTYVETLFDSLGVDAFDLLTCPAKMRAQYLASIVDVQISDEELRAAAGGNALGEEIRGKGLDRLDAFAKFLFDQRTGENRTIRDGKATIARTQRSLDGVPETPPDVAAIREERSRLEKELNARLIAADDKKREALARIKEEAQRKINEEKDTVAGAIKALEAQKADTIRQIERETAEKIAEIERHAAEAIRAAEGLCAENTRQAETGRNARVLEVKTAAEAEAEIHRAEASRAIDEANAEINPKLAELTGQLASAEEVEKACERAKESRRLIADTQAEVEKAEATAATLDAALEGLKALRLAKLAAMPITGLEIRSGEVYYQGKHWDKLNKGSRIRLALEVAQQRTKKVGLIVCDDLESLDDEAVQALINAAETDGLKVQIVGARRVKGELTVKTYPAPAENPTEEEEAA